MADDLTPTPIADLISSGILAINDGYRAKNSELSRHGLPFARAQNINNGFHFEGADCFPLENIRRVGVKISQPGDVVFTSKGTVGRFAFVGPDTPRFVYAPQLCFWRVLDRERLHPRWLYYWMHSREFFIQFSGVAGQTDMAEYVSLQDQRRMHITIPPLRQQQAIACILGALDDKIELNRTMNRTLEATARAIFKSWFVDFDPVRAKAAVRREHPKWTDEQVSRAACPNLKPEIAALFPDSFEDSELGEIPKGWSASNVGQHFRLTMGQSPPGSTYNEIGNGVPFYQGRTDFGFRYPTRRVYCTSPTRFAEPGDTLVSVRAPVGDVNMAKERCAVGRGVAAIRHRGNSRSFTYYSMHQLAQHFLKFEAEGTVFGSINKADFERLPFVVPSPDVLAAFDRVVSLLDDRIETNEEQTISLANIRDTLLPKLISGELRVPDAERIVGRCCK